MREMESQEGPCGSCHKGFIPCPHTDIDETGWCRECDTPADEVNPMVNCEDCL